MNNPAPGKPGIDPTWCSSAKDIVTTALGTSQLWATVGYGIVNEVYWPSTGQPQIRDFGFIVSDGKDWWEIKRMHDYDVTTPAPFVPLPTIIHRGPSFTFELTLVPDDIRDVLLVRYRLTPNDANAKFKVYPLIAPRLGVTGRGNSAWVNRDALMASREEAHLCLVANEEFARASCGYIGNSDGWQDFDRNGAMTWEFDSAPDGNVSMMGELDSNDGWVAIAFAESNEGALTLARSSLAEGFETIERRVEEKWKKWGEHLECPGDWGHPIKDFLLHSATVLKICEDKKFPGAVVASLSIPWGNTKDDLGGYHLVWARDGVQSGLAMLAVGHIEEAKQMAAYLIATQQPDGHWNQNFFPDGRPYWTGTQLDETAFPILLCAKMLEVGALPEPHRCKTMVRRAAKFLVQHGAVSPQDRWEENAGISAFTIAVQIAGLVAAAEFLDDDGERKSVLAHADYLNRRVEDWLYVTESSFVGRHSVRGHYIRMATPEIFSGKHGLLHIANRNGLQMPEADIIGLDYIYLSRLGLRSASSEELSNTTKVVDAELRRETPSGPSYYRYNEDGYGEHDDGRAFDGSGRGRLWPLLTGERGHFAIQLGEDVLPYLHAMIKMTGKCSLLPEQVWDAATIEEHRLFPGQPTGSAMPLLWAHAEFIKLAAAIHNGQPIELLDCVHRRYNFIRPEPKVWFWRSNQPFNSLPLNTEVVLEEIRPFIISARISVERETDLNFESMEAAFGIHQIRLDRSLFEGEVEVVFTQQFVGQDDSTRYRIGL